MSARLPRGVAGGHVLPSRRWVCLRWLDRKIRRTNFHAQALLSFSTRSMDMETYPGKGLSLPQLVFALNKELERTAYSPSYVGVLT